MSLSICRQVLCEMTTGVGGGSGGRSLLAHPATATSKAMIRARRFNIAGSLGSFDSGIQSTSEQVASGPFTRFIRGSTAPQTSKGCSLPLNKLHAEPAQFCQPQERNVQYVRPRFIEFRWYKEEAAEPLGG
ncbi:hypothetical protein D9M71_614130 [compost metagenome]